MTITGPLGPAAAGALPGPLAGAGAAGIAPTAASGIAGEAARSRFAALAAPPAQPGAPEASPASGPLRRVTGARRATAPPGVAQALGRVLAELRTDERRLDRFVRRAARGCPMELPEMLAMQSLVYKYSQRVELLSKLVERLTGAVRQTLQTPL